MNISHEWLKAFVPHALTAEQVRDLVTAHIATVEGFERTRPELEPFVIGQVVKSEKIPDTKLSFNTVDDGTGTLLEVVCGAPNVTVGAKYPFARTGTTMPGGILIEKRKIRGFASNGMLCSPRELGLGDDHDGILEITTDAAPGTPLLSVLPLSDVCLVVDVLPNRPDLLSHQGLARDVGAVTGTAVQLPPELAPIATVTNIVRDERDVTGGGVSIRLDDPASCPRYYGAVIRGVTVGPSPDWLRQRIEAVGSRSISNVVDATNYILHGFGQPVHAFDLKKIGGSQIIVRRAKVGEMLTTLDGVERKLDPSVLVIADNARATALAGIMGGKASEVTDATTDVLLEVATFAPQVVRAARKRLGMSTDASYRYERGIDDAAIPRVAEIAAALIALVAGGTVELMLGAGSVPEARAAVALKPARVSQLLGDAVSAEQVETLLKSVGFTVANAGDALRVTPPSWRHDVSRDADLVEEVARLRGYDCLPDALKSSRSSNVPDHPMHVIGRRVRDALVARGLYETRPLPYAKGGHDGPESLVRVRNPIGEDEPFLRESLLGTLAGRAEHNLSRMQGDVRIFEIGTSFAARAGGSGSGGGSGGVKEEVRVVSVEDEIRVVAVKEEIRVGALIMGARRPRHFTEPEPPAWDAWDAKALGEMIATAAWPGSRVELVPVERVSGATAVSASLGSVSGRDLWSIMVQGTLRGLVREVTLDAPVWASPAFGVEITLGKMPANPVAAQGAHNYAKGERAASVARVAVRYAALPITPAAEFDLALIVPDAVPAGEVERLMRVTSGDLLEVIHLFDEYRGGGVPHGTRSLAWRLTFRHPERTLRDKEIEGRRSQLLKTLEKEIGVVARTN